jgi:hypothetical protein
VRASNHFGYFIFPKTVLCEKGIVSKNKKDGKRAMRIYPSWDRTGNPQAWQLLCFFEIQEKLDFSRLKSLFNLLQSNI